MWELLGGLLTPAFAVAFAAGVTLAVASAWALSRTGLAEHPIMLVVAVSLVLAGDILLGLSADGWLESDALHVGVLGWAVYALPLLMIAGVLAAALVSIPAVIAKRRGRQLERRQHLRLVAAVALILWLPLAMGIPWIEGRMFF